MSQFHKRPSFILGYNSLKSTNYESNTSLYYPIVVGHLMKGQPPVAVAEFISTEHSVMALSHFHKNFHLHEDRPFACKS